MSGTRFFGKYRGTVANNVDPDHMGRIQVKVPGVFGSGTLAWAMPCVPYAGPNVGLFLVPPLNANVWVEFEAGSPDSPIWAGGFWNKGEAPSPAVAEVKVLETDCISITASDLSGGGLTIEVSPPAVDVAAKLAITSKGIEISTASAKIVLSSSGVSVNDGALEVI